MSLSFMSTPGATVTATGTNERLIGLKIEAEPGRTEADGVIPLVDGYTITGGVALFPIFASKWTSFVQGADLVVPNGWNGSFTRNLGGNADTFETKQGDLIGSHSHTYTRPPINQFTGRGNGGNTARRGTNASAQTASTGGVETRPENFALQFYLLLDTF
jgi:hypothetical protein